MTNVAKTYSYLCAASILAHQYTAIGKEPRSLKKTLLDTIRQTDPAKADALKKQLDDTEQVIAQLRFGRSKTLQSIKAEAAEKIKRIKEQIKLLMMMGGDPKMIARQIAQLAKDLASAARSYSSATAGGTSTPDNAASADAKTTTSGDNTVSTAAQSDSTAGCATESVVVSTVPVSGEPTASEKKKEKDGTTSPNAPLTSSADVAQDRGICQYQDALRQQMKTDLQNKTAALTQKDSETAADRQFAQEVRTLAALLKSLIRQQKLRLHQPGDQTTGLSLTQALEALAEAERNASG